MVTFLRGFMISKASGVTKCFHYTWLSELSTYMGVNHNNKEKHNHHFYPFSTWHYPVY